MTGRVAMPRRAGGTTKVERRIRLILGGTAVFATR
jgi:hypothetical protein